MRKMNLQLFVESIPAAGEIKRKWMAYYIGATLPSASKTEYSCLGEDLKECIAEMNTNVEIKDNIQGETSINLGDYQPQASADPYYAEIEKSLFDRLQDTVDERRILDNPKASVVEMHLWEPVEATDGTYMAYRKDVTIEIFSYGGNTTGYRILFSVHHTGSRVKGKLVLATRTFTADT